MSTKPRPAPRRWPPGYGRSCAATPAACSGRPTPTSRSTIAASRWRAVHTALAVSAAHAHPAAQLSHRRPITRRRGRDRRRPARRRPRRRPAGIVHTGPPPGLYAAAARPTNGVTSPTGSITPPGNAAAARRGGRAGASGEVRPPRLERIARPRLAGALHAQPRIRYGIAGVKVTTPHASAGWSSPSSSWPTPRPAAAAPRPPPTSTNAPPTTTPSGIVHRRLHRGHAPAAGHRRPGVAVVVRGRAERGAMAADGIGRDAMKTLAQYEPNCRR